MLPYSPEQVAAAKRIDLLSYLQARRPHELVRAGPHEYRTVTHSSLVISNGKWRWFREGIGGTTALNYLMKVENYTFLEAMQELSGSPSPQPVQRMDTAAPGVFALPTANHTDRHVRSYLQSRGICDTVLDECIQSGRLYEQAVYAKKGLYAGRVMAHNCVFVGFDPQGAARFACVREAGPGRFRRDVDFSEKKYGFCFPAAESGNPCVAVFEAPIDALSHATLTEKEKGAGWCDRHRLALAGDSLIALRQFLADHPKITTIEICTDNDPTGRRIAADIHGLCDGAYTVRDRFPPKGKDYNDYLMMKKERSRTR
ncbi:MAG TPA: DUF3991 and toprim domain-containing protein [Firmicutes bacterium]|nr:DUF3991 and toprim domain-containing protein [Bacillota bacterium]